MVVVQPAARLIMIHQLQKTSLQNAGDCPETDRLDPMNVIYDLCLEHLFHADFQLVLARLKD